MGFIGCISNYKGGTGKTTSTVNIAAALALQKKRVLIIDNDPQSDSTKAVLPRNSQLGDTLYELLDPESSDPPELIDCIYPTIHDRLFIIPNTPETAGLEMPLAKRHPESNLFLRNRIRDYATQNFDFTFIDCPPTLSIFVNNAMYASDFLIIPMDAGSGNSLAGVRGVLDLMDTVKQDGDKNPSLRFLKILTNKVDKRKSIHKAVINNLEIRFGKENIFKNAIPTSARFEEVEALQGQTIFTHAGASKGATCYRGVAKEIVEAFK